MLINAKNIRLFICHKVYVYIVGSEDFMSPCQNGPLRSSSLLIYKGHEMGTDSVNCTSSSLLTRDSNDEYGAGYTESLEDYLAENGSMMKN